MKTIAEIKKEYDYGDVYTTKSFSQYVEGGYFTSWDGCGVLHNGEDETDIDAFSVNLKSRSIQSRYPYVLWFNK